MSLLWFCIHRIALSAVSSQRTARKSSVCSWWFYNLEGLCVVCNLIIICEQSLECWEEGLDVI